MKNLIQTFSKSKLTLGLSAALFLSACGGTDQDTGTVSTTQQVFSGVAIDPYIARATVFLDSNNNGTRDAWEAWAFTDNDGYYSYNPLTEKNYCASDASPQDQQYCLVTNVTQDNVIVRIDGGYDVITGEPFLGQLSRRVNTEVQNETIDSVTSPLTTLFSGVETDDKRSSLLSSLSIDEGDLDVDYLNTNGSGGVNAPLLNTALKIHKVVAVLSDRLTDTYTEIGEEFGTPNDASSAVYPNLAEQIINAGTTLDASLSNANLLTSVLDQAENSLREVYTRKEFEMPADLGSVSNPNNFSRIVDIAKDIPNVVNVLVDVNTQNSVVEDIIGGTRALESIVLKVLDESSANDASIDTAINFFTDTNNTDLVESLMNALSENNADISGLSENDFTGDDFNSVESVITASTLPNNAEAFTRIGGLTLKVSDLDLGSAPDRLEDTEVEFYFNGSESSVEGAFEACIKHIADANIDGSLGDGNTRGELISGYWSLLGATVNDRESYSLLVTLTFLGTTYQAILKPAGESTINNIDYKNIRFDNDGDFKVYHSTDGLIESGTIPSTNQQCQERLPSRVGI